MLTRKIARKYVSDFLTILVSDFGYNPSRVMIFGSVAKGKAHAHSDIDVAIWDSKFTGCGPIDCEPIARLLNQFPLIELHYFEEGEGKDYNPFICEIEKEGF
ncbi:MAG: nucleotidyltransferase domain-containing protein, partial [Bacteroidota bacterium]|nr:nucleotidyltransferase domain-containing protein [Bacteroidota bacterium]